MSKKKKRKFPPVSFTKVFVRFRPLLKEEINIGSIEGVTTSPTEEENVIKLTFTSNNRLKTLKFGKFHKTFVESENNEDLFRFCVLPLLREKGHFGTICTFAYGHSGTGKTHSIIGYGKEKGIFRQTIERCCGIIGKDVLLSFTFSEIYNNKVFDLFNDGVECNVRNDGKGNMLIRSPVIFNKETGTVRVNPLKAHIIRNIEDALKAFQYGSKFRATGSSTIHDKSSRSHALLSVEVVNHELLDLREEILVAESELVPTGKKKLDLEFKMYGKYSKEKLKEIAEELERVKIKFKELEDLLELLRGKEEKLLKDHKSKNEIVGSFVLFVDLAGSDYETIDSGMKLSKEEKKESREINLSLLALKECIRNIKLNKRPIPFRNSKLTMILKKYLLRDDSKVVMIATCSPCKSQVNATNNTLKYTSLVSSTK